MGGNSSKGAPTYYTNESEKSARNVLENFAKDIKGKASNDAKKKGISLKGYLRQAKFYHDFSKLYPNYRSPCDLNFWFHTNVWKRTPRERDPCYRRQPKNNPNLEGAVCTNSKIKGNENKIIDIGACAPYRRRNICDYNLEHLNERNVLNTHDLLGNVLVMAKREGESIVNSQANNGTLNVCTALARSFADIGDIVRGTDLFLGGPSQEKKKLEENLKKIFENIKNKNTKLSTLTLEKVREYWWALNRNDVWKALTCSAPYEAQYFIKSSDKEHSFSSEYCGHYKNGDPLTNLDYVPQFLRWFEEWAEEFCRIRYHKLKRIKDACRNDSKKLYCSHNGYDCTKTSWKKGVLHWSNECTDCSVKCKLYEIWLGNQREAFRKQKEKYEKEIETYVSNRGISNTNINNEYYKEFYEELKKSYKSVHDFLTLLNEGRYCKTENVEEEVIDFNSDMNTTFYRSDYCQVCPDCGVECNKGTCKKKPNDSNCRNNEAYIPPRDVTPTKINVLYSGDGHGDITKKLKGFCSNPTDYDGKNYENWQCYYKSSEDNKCQMTSLSQTLQKHHYVMSFYAFFDFWVRKFLIDTIKWENELKNCINNTTTDCSDGCNKHCVCFDKWVKQKEKEWNSIKKLFTKKNNVPQPYYTNINNLFDSFYFQVMYELNHDEAKWKELTQELRNKINSSKKNTDAADSKDAIELLLEYLKEKSTICKDNNTNEACDPTVDPTKNPCGKNTKAGSDKVISVKQIAQYYKRQAYSEANNRSDGLYKLKGKAHEGIYKQGGGANDFKDNLCRIMIKHSNRDPKRSRGPCYGKDGSNGGVRMKIGTTWQTGRGIQIKDPYLYLPPRRQHICTSNLEKIHVSSVTKKSNVNASFLVHVLLAAKMDAQKIKDLYKSQNGKTGLTEENDKRTICRAIRYSFADIGDIIRGRDMWSKNGDEQRTQGRLKTVFGIIKKNMPGIKDNQKYKDDEKNNPPYKLLREDWWEANRDQVWKAMKCHIKDFNVKSGDKSPSSHCGYSDHTPLDDYVPQRLRWMTEWAEWFCKAQKKEYEKLKKDCQECKEKDAGCWKGESVCEKCKKACEAYNTKIQEWKDQWKIISAKYKELYKEAEIYARNGGPGYYNTEVQKEDKPVVDFLYELHLQNGGKKGPPAATHPSKSVTTRVKRDTTVDTPSTVYSTAEGYVHQEAAMDCKEQHVFCESGDKKKYAFKEPPPDYEKACECEKNTKPPAPKPPSTPNPCVRKDQSGTHIVSVEDVAEGMQEAAHKNMVERSVVGSGESKVAGKDSENVSVLKGDIKEAEFRNGGEGKNLNGDICKIDTTYSNDSRGTTKDGPCTGKDGKHEMFKVKDGWKSGAKISEKHPLDVFLPPRREHFCTSNVEHLNTNVSGLTGSNASDSLLGDVLLAAKYEADYVKEKYKRKETPDVFNDNETICRAMKYSFADIGDIIKGTDLWDRDRGENKTQGHLVKIFQKIKTELKGTFGKKYDSDSNGKHLQLRKDWWEANRHQVWKAMQCGNDNPCSGVSGVPFDDYIPQRLRWMTEWAEWYCKMQSQEYEKVQHACEKCNVADGKCTKEMGECKQCEPQCKQYTEFIKKWKTQWETISKKYGELYKKATESGDIKDDKEKYVVEFLRKLHEQNGGGKSGATTAYSTAAGYVHQEVSHMNCKEQKIFCKKSDGKYAFEEMPTEYEQACKCEGRDKTKVPPKKKKDENDDVCNMVKARIGNNDGTKEIEHCNPKTGTYPPWECDKRLVHEDGVCMPPRRQKLCVIYLQYLSKTATETELRKAFIECAAVETFFLWHKYKKDKNGGADLQTKLEGGTISEDFKRQMFYTFGDFRDFLFGTDISKGHGIGSELAKKIDSLFKNIGGKTTNGKTRQEWWNEHKEAIWKGMLCALSYNTNEKTFKQNVHTNLIDAKNNNTYPTVKFSGENSPTLEKFAERPQFLRWFIEWGEEFCRTRGVKIKELVDKCKEYECDSSDNSKKEECKKACEDYKKWLQKWKDQYKQQSAKFTTDKGKKEYEVDPDVKKSTHAYQYLHAQLKKLCKNGDCTCMEKPSTQSQPDAGKKPSAITDMPEALDYPPTDYKKKCDCKVPVPPSKKPEAPPQQARLPAAVDSGNDHRARSEGGGQRPARPPTPPAPRVLPRQPPQPKPPAGEGGVGRNLPPVDRNKEISDSSEDEEEEEEDETQADATEKEVQEKKEEQEENGKGDPKDTVDVSQEPLPEAPQGPKVEDICKIVKDALTIDTLKQACPTKYEKGREKFPNWKCISDTTTTKPGADRAPSGTNQGSICVPPRRRRLYVGKLHDWANNSGSDKQAGGSEAPSQPNSAPSTPKSSGKDPREALRDAFIESAAVETFFLWHKYKAENTKRQGVDGSPLLQLPVTDSDSDPSSPQTQLQSGNIPTDFLRLMFYTLGDYRDICIGGDRDIVGDTIVSNTDSTEISSGKATKISDVIKEFLSKQNSGDNPSPRSVKTGSNSGNDPASLWNKHGPDIWNGMVCALTYKETSGSGGEKTTTITQDTDLKEQLFESGKNTPKTEYQYDKVKLEEESSGAQPNQPPSASSGDNKPTTLNNPKLKNFVEIPTYFRWLEEWGEEFCRERGKRLEKIKYECRGDRGGHQYCSGDGHDCTDPDNQHNKMLANLYCRDCHKECRKYRKWIDLKFEEYHKQEKKYKGEHDKLTNGDNSNGGGDNNCCKEIKKHSTAADFLAALKHCKNSEGNGSDPNNKINFNDPKTTFGPLDYCKTCPPNKVNCNGRGRARGRSGGTNGCTEKDPNWKTVFNGMSGNSGKTTTIDVEMIDRRGPYIEKYLGDSNDLFKTSKLFKGIRKQNWTYNIDLNEYTTFKVLLIYWLEDFLYGYYILKKKRIIDLCTKNGGNTCDKEPKIDCVCVKKWVDQKKEEWGKIKEHFNNRNQTKGDDDMKSSVKMFLEDLQHLTELNKAIKPCGTLQQFESFCGLNGDGESKSDKEVTKEENDLVLCMIRKLKDKIDKCKAQHTGEETETECQEHTPLPDEEDLLLEETENPVTQPNICPPQKPETKVVDEDACITDAPQPDVKEEEEEKEEEKDKKDEEEEEEEEDEEDEAEEEESSDENHDDDSDYETEDEDQDELDPAVPLSPSESQPKRLLREFPSTELKNAMLFSTILCMVGIGFAAFTYFFLKKKPKSPVDLLRVLDIPKGDYGIPTPKSSNRYIPYASDRHKGKTYIYMEGDSDSGHYYEDTTDITSSESEYEEMDINDIYVPGSPKYKTLIEVVLEPSGKNTPTSDIPSDTPSNKLTDEEWSELKHDFISQYIQSEPLDVPKVGVSKELPMNTTEGNVLDVGMEEKPFITSIHDRDLYTGEEISYNINMSTNSMDDPKYVSNNVYSGIDLINDSLNSGNQPIDIYDEVLKRKENELFGTNYKKNTSNNSVAKNTNNDPIMNQLDLLHKWLDRHRDMCEMWNNKEELLDKLNEQWNKDNDGGNVPIDNRSLNTDVWIEIDMDDTTGKKELSNMDTILDDMEDDIYYDVNDENPFVDHIPMDHNKVDVPKKVHVEMKIHNNTSNGSLEPEFPISDVWNI
ncbi:hypothetical protein PFDG_00862 [Plasmodium falciparum Dd2]|uniref:Erythrocyte membrane protein 1 n=4 Tax=Plasmodium falciparum TaxID=5833 RepID=A0A0L7LXY1_PLAF4|nr:hypothetical protein PFDG_00862 [Plasmodium falciparum Dd2]